ncbi:uncharacterized protein ACNS7B_008700 isoform 2-T3 [Menidia menidia]
MLHSTHFKDRPAIQQYLKDGIFKCPCCKFSTEDNYKLSYHIDNHFKHAVHHAEYDICKCNLQCRSAAHYHCLYCNQTIIRKDHFTTHLNICSSKTPLSSSASPHQLASSISTTSAPPSPAASPHQLSSSIATTSAPPSPAAFLVPSSAPPHKRRKKESVMCPHCAMTMNRRNVRLHIERKHKPKGVDITATKHLKSQAIDYKNGIFAVVKSFLGPNTPIHVVKRTWGKEQSTKCENPSLTEDVLQEMVSEKWFGEDKKERCLKRQREATDAGTPLSCKLSICNPSTKRFISIYEPTVSYYSRLGRIMVTFDTKQISWHCPCARPRQSCLHKYIAKWHLFQFERALFQRTQSVEEELVQNRFPTEVEGGEEEEEEGGHYPPEGDVLEKMVQYIYHHKRMPSVLDTNVVMSENFPRLYTPAETFCTECSEAALLGEPELITTKGRILTVTGVIEGISLFRKQCNTCGMMYRYQEWSDGVYNFDDKTLLSLHLCLFLRNSLQTHQAVSRTIEVLERTYGQTYPSKNRILHAYLAFEALCDHEYTYACVSCGHNPVCVVMDLHKKGVFNMPVSNIDKPPEGFDGNVNIEDFWDKVSMEMISRGFVPSNKANPFIVRPSYKFWAPWIGPHTRRGSVVLNTEDRKIHSPHSAKEEVELTVTEDRLKDELLKLKMEAVRSLCRHCGIDPKGSRLDLIIRLQTEMKNRASYDKVFSHVWGASGGWAVVTCPCAVVYAVKFNLRAESPRDFIDLLLSMKHFPNITLYDFARGLATHANTRLPGTFRPHDGRLLEPTLTNISLASSGQVKANLPWLAQKKEVPDFNGHPITGSSERYALYDRFHEANTKDARDVLRRVDLAQELCGWLNSQCAEQLFSGMRKNNYFLNMMTPSSHVFLMRNILHHYNTAKNLATIENMKKMLGVGYDIGFNSYGQTVLAGINEAQDPTTTADEGQGPAMATDQVPNTGTTEAPVLDLSVCRPDCWGLPHLRHLLARSGIPESQVDYVLDARRSPTEIIGTIGTTNLRRKDFQSLGLQQNLEATIANCCMELICDMAWWKKKDVYAADAYVVATWHAPSFQDPFLNLPADAASKDLLIFPVWKPGHWFLCDPPGQAYSNDCGVFMVMYALYMALGWRFDFGQDDMPWIRRWWCHSMLANMALAANINDTALPSNVLPAEDLESNIQRMGDINP